jgi:tRNA pseudouridine55 synthase
VDGLIVLDKPAGVTSFDVVRRVRGLVRRHSKVRRPKVGHTGTLDPFATGVLPIAVGKATRLAQFLIDGDKRYRATLRLGRSTTTDDAEGEALLECDVSQLTEEMTTAALSAWRGPHQQKPPVFCAIKVDGVRAYDEARAGRPMDLPPRDIVIHALDVGKTQIPDVEFEVHASKGTYIRALCRDVGEALGVGGHCSALRRLDAAGFNESEAHDIEALVVAEELPVLSCLEMLRGLPQWTVDGERAAIIRNGGWVRLETPRPAFDGPIAVTEDGVRLLCVAVYDGEKLQPIRVIDA